MSGRVYGRVMGVAVAAVVLAEAVHGAAPAPVYAGKGLVVSASSHASEAGVAILKRGGNAVDAAAAVGFALAVTHPQAGNLGGGGFLLARFADGRTLTMDFRETAPAGAHGDMFLDEDGEVVEGLSLETVLASGVPGSVDGLLKVWEEHGSGTISQRALLAPAIRLASRGVELSRPMARQLNGRRAFFERDAGASAIFARGDGRSWEAGDVLRQRDLADTLRRIRRHGREGFYGGRTASMLAEFMEREGGLITLEDLAAYESRYRPAVTGTYRGHEIVSMGPPSSGGVLIVQMLNMLEAHDLGALGWGSSDYVHVLTEAQRRAYADRAEHLGDPDYWAVPMAMLASKAYARERAAGIELDRATPSGEVFAGEASHQEGTETTHYSVVDKDGNAVAVTTTLNASYGSGIVAPGTGFFLNNEMDDFSAKPGEPNLYGLVGAEANAIEPGKRMLSSMTPTIVLRDGAPYIVVGSPGGATIITTVLQVILNVVDHGMDIQEAVSAPRHHSQWLPDEIAYEPRAFPRDVAERLEAMGHGLTVRRSIGQANSLMITGRGYFGAPDPRGDNAAAGF